MTSILLIAEAEDSIQQSINRALMLARYLRARLDILLCCTERGYVPLSAQAPETRAQARAYLESLRTSVAAPDVEITTEAAFEGRLHEQVARKAQAAGSTMLVKSTERLGGGSELRIDWPLLLHAPAPVLLTQGRAWQPRPRFGFAVEAPDRAAAASVPQDSRMLAALCEACGAQLQAIPWGAADDADGEIDLLALPVQPGPRLPALIRRLTADRPALSGGDLLFLPP
jgi:hypothetical protein